MRLDFRSTHQGTHEAKEPLKISPWVMRIAIAIVGVLALIFLISSMVSTSTMSHPYAVFLFSKPDRAKPQTEVRFLWVDEQRKQVTLVTVPDDTEYVSTTLGTYPMSSIFAARTLSSMSDTDFIRDLSFFFRMPVLGYVESQSTVQGKSGIVSGLRSYCLNPKSRSLSFSSCLHFIFFSAHPSTALEVTTIPDSVFSGKNSAGMQKVDRSAYTEWRRRKLSYQLAGASKTSIAILNLSGRSGAATRVSSLFDDFGLHTILVSDAKDTQDQGRIFVQPGKGNEEIVQFIADLLHLPIEENAEKTQENRADIVVFIGTKEAKAFTP